MNDSALGSLDELVQQLKRLPGIGEKTATRLAHFVIRQPLLFAQEFSSSVLSAREKLQLCELCHTFTEHPLCKICANASRQDDLICVVEGPTEMGAFEKTAQFKGKYHVLHGVISPLEGTGENNLKIKELKDRVKAFKVKEVILATNPTVEGDTTALYIARAIKHDELKVTRIAYGIPVGAEIEYLDGATLGKALTNRVLI